MALTICLATALFILTSRIAHAPLAVTEPSALRFVYAAEHGRSTAATLAELNRLSALTEGRVAWAAAQADTTVLAAGIDRRRLEGERTTDSYFDLLQPVVKLGRTYSSSSSDVVDDGVVVISEDLWSSRFARNPDVIGQTLALNRHEGRDRDYTIIGVVAMPFRGVLSPWRPADYWVPVGSRVRDLLGGERPQALSRASFEVLVGRPSSPKDAIGLDAAVVQWVGAIAHSERDARFPREAYPRVVRDSRAVRLPFHAGGSRPEDVLRIIWLTVAAVFLVGLLNLAGLFASRSIMRQPEIRTRVILGVSPRALSRQLVCEAAIISSFAGAVAILLAPATAAVIVHGIPRSPAAWFSEDLVASVAAPDLATTLFALCACVVATGAIAWLPIRESITQQFSAAGISGAMTASRPLRRALAWGIAAPQVAAATVLVMLAGGALAGWRSIAVTPIGYTSADVGYARLDLPPDADVDALLRLLREDPAVSAFALTSAMPSNPVEGIATGWASVGKGSGPQRVSRTAVTSGYFDVLDIRIEAGRDFSAGDLIGAPRVVIVDESAARRLWPGQAAVGQRLVLGGVGLADQSSVSSNAWLEVIGVVGTISPPVPNGLLPGSVYVPAQRKGRENIVLFHSSRQLTEAHAAIRHYLSRAGSEWGILEAGSLDESIVQQRYPYVVIAVLLSAAGVLSLGFAVLGIFAVSFFGVSRRHREFGVRATLGADGGVILRQVVLEATRVGVTASIIGVAVGVFSMRLIAHHFRGMVAAGWTEALLAVLAANLVVALAVLWPAMLASRTDPAAMLRSD